jgi:hypothetical protein
MHIYIYVYYRLLQKSLRRVCIVFANTYDWENVHRTTLLMTPTPLDESALSTTPTPLDDDTLSTTHTPLSPESETDSNSEFLNPDILDTDTNPDIQINLDTQIDPDTQINQNTDEEIPVITAELESLESVLERLPTFFKERLLNMRQFQIDR